MKKSSRLFISGSVQSMFFEQYLKEEAARLQIKGYMRKAGDGRLELFLEGDGDNVREMIALAKRGTQHTQIRNVEEKNASFQGFSEFKILKI